MADTNTANGTPTTNDTDLATIESQAFLKTVNKAAKGDAKALAEMRAMCKAHPELWDVIETDIAGVVRDANLKRLTGEDAVMLEGVNRQLGRMKRDLLGTNASPLEKLLADRICACWVQVQYAEWRFATKKAGESFQLCDYLQRLVDRANHRYIAAIRALAQIRRLSVPMVQVNVAEKQVNVATPQVNVSSEAVAGNAEKPPPPALAAGNATPVVPMVEGAAREAVRQTFR